MEAQRPVSSKHQATGTSDDARIAAEQSEYHYHSSDAPLVAAKVGFDYPRRVLPLHATRMQASYAWWALAAPSACAQRTRVRRVGLVHVRDCSSL